MSSSLNLSSTNDASTPLTHVPRPTTTIRIENEPANNNPVYTNCQPTPSPIRQRLTSVNTPVKCVTSPQGNHLMPLAPPAPAKRRNADQIQEASSIRSFKEKYFPAFVKEAKYKKQERAAKTLGIVVGAFLLCWSPFFLLLPVEAACPDCDLKTIFNIAFWLGYINSCLNPLIYVCSSRELRKSFQNVLCFRKKSANNVV